MNNWINGVKIEMTAEEETAALAEFALRAIPSDVQKLTRLKELRIIKLKQTDWWVLRGAMTEAQTAKRQAWRDIPATYTTEEQYDTLLVVDGDGELTHSIWSIE